MCTRIIKPKPDKPRMEKRVGRKIQKVIKEPLQLSGCWGKEGQFFSTSSPVHEPHSRRHYLGIFRQHKLATMGKMNAELVGKGKVVDLERVR